MLCWWIHLTGSAFYLMKSMKIFHLLLPTLSMELSLFISIVKKFMQGAVSCRLGVKHLKIPIKMLHCNFLIIMQKMEMNSLHISWHFDPCKRRFLPWQSQLPHTTLSISSTDGLYRRSSFRASKSDYITLSSVWPLSECHRCKCKCLSKHFHLCVYSTLLSSLY